MGNPNATRKMLGFSRDSRRLHESRAIATPQFDFTWRAAEAAAVGARRSLAARVSPNFLLA
jgi:hypothetical protein